MRRHITMAIIFAIMCMSLYHTFAANVESITGTALQFGAAAVFPTDLFVATTLHDPGYWACTSQIVGF